MDVEMSLAYRDMVGMKSTVELHGEKVLIKDLPMGLYNLSRDDSPIAAALGPQYIPGALLNYCARLEKEDYEFEGDTVPEMVSNLEVILKPTNSD